MKTSSSLGFLALTLFPGSLLRAQASAPASQESRPRLVEVATLGIDTRAPTQEETEQRGLKHEVRVRGRVVTGLDQEGAAVVAGIAKGDVLVRLGRNELFSDDDLGDFLRVSKPGQKVEALLVRAKDGKEAVVQVTLGVGKVEAPRAPELRWDFASLAQLPDALARAKKEGRLVVVGLSGAET
jgi:predicted metalloprotease with PDZ domain